VYDFTTDHDGMLAVDSNARAVAKTLGYESPADTRVRRIIIAVDRDDHLVGDVDLDLVSEDFITEVQQAAIFLEGLAFEATRRSYPPGSCLELRIDDDQRLKLARFVGETIARDATCPAKTNRWIFRKLFHGEYPLAVHIHM
tara:strand:- start:3557 stop:3982 length:426 start_codon:yes stop_codon:yes gene_type:complete